MTLESLANANEGYLGFSSQPDSAEGCKVRSFHRPVVRRSVVFPTESSHVVFQTMLFHFSKAKLAVGFSPMVSRSRSDGTSEKPASQNLLCRIVQISLALYLIPACLVVLVVGSLGIVTIGLVRMFTGSSNRTMH